MTIGRRGRIEAAILLPSFAPYDAIGNHVVELRTALIEAGLEARIYAEEIKAGADAQALPSSKLLHSRPRPGRYLIYQLSTNSNFFRHLIARGEALAVQYHNITPRNEVVGFDGGMATAVARGRRQLEELRRYTDLAIGVSAYNADELVASQYKRVAVAPPLIRALGATVQDRDYTRGPHRLLFVGRLAPNKAQEDLIAALAVYNATFAPRARLTLVGGTAVSAYADYLRALANELGVAGDVEFASGLPKEELARLYGESHLFVSSSRHEGFGFPIIEAMRAGLPVAAYASSAIPETAGTAALLTTSADPPTLATSWRMLLVDEGLRKEVVASGIARSREFDLGRAKLANLSALANLIPIESVDPSPLYYTAPEEPGKPVRS